MSLYSSSNDEDQLELFESGLLYPVDGNPVVVHRGMTILNVYGEAMGMVAGVIKSRYSQYLKYILLSRPSQKIEHRVIAISLIQQVSEETVVLQIPSVLVNTLPHWHG